MLEITGDFWKIWQLYDIVCIPTNGNVKTDGRAVMGAGLAKNAKEKWSGIDLLLGKRIKEFGIGVMAIQWLVVGCKDKEIDIYAFPTKYHWKEKADLSLIEKSARQLAEGIEEFGDLRVLLPQPGTGLGRLSWEKEIRPILAPILDDRVTVIGRV